MEHVSVESVEAVPDSATVKRPLTAPLGLANAALNYYELAPGASFAFGYHAHERQEELFYVLDGTATFETEARTVAVGPGEAVRFAPGEYQRGWNGDDERVRALAVGAPRETGESEVLRDCEACGERTPQAIETVEDGAARITRCLECGAETARFERSDPA